MAALIARPDARLRVAVVHGADRGAVADAANGLLKRLTPDPEDPFTVTVFTDSELVPDRVADALASRALGGARRVVRLRMGGELGAKDRILHDLVQGHLEDAFTSDAYFLVECGPLDKRSLVRKAVEASERAVGVALYEDEPGDIGKLASDVLTAAGLRVSPAVIAALVQRLPRDRGCARRSLDALIAYVGPGGRLDPADLDAVLPAEDGAISAEVASSAFGGRVQGVVDGLRKARFAGESGPALLRSLTTYRSRLARAKAAVEAGVAPQVAVKSAGVFWKDEQDYIQQLGAWRSRDLQRLQETLTAADIACKTAGAPDETIAHQCALEIALHAATRRERSGVR